MMTVIYTDAGLFLTHLPLGEMIVISHTKLTDAFSWMKIFVFWWKFVCNGLINNKTGIGLDNGLTPIRRQAIILINADPINKLL